MENADGYIKFKCNYSLQRISEMDVQQEIIHELIYYRQKLFGLGLIGSDDKGIGFGNISYRISKSKFLITGTATGIIDLIGTEHFSLVNNWNLENNELSCEGEIKASSESLTHGAIYQTLSNVNAAIHIHSKQLWLRYLDKYPTTPEYAEYGTTDIAKEIINTINSNLSERTIILGGHKDGVIIYDSNLKNAFRNLLSIIGKN
jgi:hypothetical protein